MRNRFLLERRAVVPQLLADRGDLLVVSGLGAATYDCAAAGDHALNLYLWGAMGSAAMIGLGLASAQPTRPVLVITGDGEVLMGLGSLATVGVRKPPNLAVVVLDNEHYGETGNQPTHTADGVDLAGVAAAAGFAHTFRVDDETTLATAQPSRPVLVITGDGEMLMGLGALATVGVAKPTNLAIVVLDNERYGETGMQPTHTALQREETGSAASPVARKTFCAVKQPYSSAHRLT